MPLWWCCLFANDATLWWIWFPLLFADDTSLPPMPLFRRAYLFGYDAYCVNDHSLLMIYSLYFGDDNFFGDEVYCWYCLLDGVASFWQWGPFGNGVSLVMRLVKSIDWSIEDTPWFRRSDISIIVFDLQSCRMWSSIFFLSICFIIIQIMPIVISCDFLWLTIKLLSLVHDVLLDWGMFYNTLNWMN